jgi:glycosyltransferase involved in cell wall biosynthesis
VAEPRVWCFHDSRGFGSPKPSGCGYFRVVLPFDQLKAHGWHANYACGLPERGEGEYDIFVGQRCDQPLFRPVWDALREIRKAEGLKLVYEIDDDPFSLDPVNWLAAPSFTRADVLAAIAYFATTADLVTVTTEALAARLRRFSQNVAVLPNCVPAFTLDLPKPAGDRPLTIGWAGGCSHSRDVSLIAQAWRDVTDETGCRGHFVGTDFRNVTRSAGFDWTPWEPEPSAYYRNIDFDIGLAPLSEHKFNGGKSPLKALEYAALGIPVIASDHPVYRDFVADGVTGFLCSTQEQWRDRMRLLLDDEGLRTSMGAKARELAATWTIEGNWTRWADAYRSLTEDAA